MFTSVAGIGDIFTHPVWHVHHAFIRTEFQHTAVGGAACAPALNLEEHGILNVQRRCT